MKKIFILAVGLYLTSCSQPSALLEIDQHTWQIDSIKIHHFGHKCHIWLL